MSIEKSEEYNYKDFDSFPLKVSVRRKKKIFLSLENELFMNSVNRSRDFCES